MRQNAWAGVGHEGETEAERVRGVLGDGAERDERHGEWRTRRMQRSGMTPWEGWPWEGRR